MQLSHMTSGWLSNKEDSFDILLPFIWNIALYWERYIYICQVYCLQKELKIKNHSLQETSEQNVILQHTLQQQQQMLQQETIRNGELEDTQTKLEKQVYIISPRLFYLYEIEIFKIMNRFLVSFLNCCLARCRGSCP